MSLDITLVDNRCKCCGRGDNVWEGNITHNLTGMANALGVYGVVWRPEENGIEAARDLLPRLAEAIDELRNNTEAYVQYEAENGWGTIGGFLCFLCDYDAACIKYPDAVPVACR